jgi:hypothetical protein
VWGGILFFYNHFIPSGFFILRGAPFCGKLNLSFLFFDSFIPSGFFILRGVPFCGKEKGENSPNQTPKG